MEQTNYTSLFAANTKTLASLVPIIKMICSYKKQKSYFDFVQLKDALTLIKVELLKQLLTFFNGEIII